MPVAIASKTVPFHFFFKQILKRRPTIKPKRNLMMNVLRYVFQPYPKAKSQKPMPRDPASPPINGPQSNPARTQKRFPK